MHTAEHETLEHSPFAHGPLAFLGKRRFMQSEDTMIATLAAWSVGLLIFTLAGFYIGTIAGHENHPAEGLRHVDLNPSQVMAALPFAGAGLLIGFIFALWVTYGYVPAKLKELDAEGVAH